MHQRNTHLPALKMPDQDRNHTHLQHLAPKPDWVPEDAPYTSHDRAYHYANSIQHLARVLGDADRPTAHPGAPGDTETPTLPLSAPASMRPSPAAETTHPGTRRATTIPH